MKNFNEYVKKRELEEAFNLPKTKDFLTAVPLTAALLGANFMAGDPIRSTVHNIMGQKDIDRDVIASVKVIPKDLIRASQFDINKWDKDYENLKSPGEADYGFATHKDLLNKPAIVHVIKHNSIISGAQEGLIRVGFARPDTLEVFMSDRLFKELPSGNNIGKLTRSGLNTLAHELRHLSQSSPPKDRETSMEDSQAKYMNNPVEMGVRLAALKNLMSKSMLERVGETLRMPNTRLALKVLPNDEKQMLDYILNPKKWKDAMTQESISQGLRVDDDEYYKIAVAFANKLGEMNSDISSLLQHYRLLSPAKKIIYLQELLDSYDQVVTNQKSNKKYA